jgi:hypothetical protein
MTAPFTTRQTEKLNDIAKTMIEELGRATARFGKFNSAHEGYAIIKEELDELWDAIKTKMPDDEKWTALYVECIQIGAMAMRFIYDILLQTEKADDQ